MNRNDDHQGDEQLLTRLLKDTGRGPTASEVARQRIYRTVHERWRSRVAEPAPANVLTLGTRRHRRASWLPLAIAAALGVVALSAYFLRPPGSAEGAQFATVAELDGSASITRDGRTLPLVPGADGPLLRVGDRLNVPAGSGLALSLAGGESLRIAAASDLRIAAVDQVRLINGSIYFDSYGMASDDPLVIDSAFGSLRHLGTQYLATVENLSLTLRVREGSVAFSDDSRRLQAMAGEELTIRRTGQPDRRQIGSTDAGWQWAEHLGSLQGEDRRPLSEVLEWVARETGRELHFADAAAAARARAVIVSGLLGLSAEEAIEALRNTTGFRFELPAAEASLIVTGISP